MNIKLAQLSDNIRIAVLDGGMKVYYLGEISNKEIVGLSSEGKVIAGATLEAKNFNNTTWYRIDTLWASSAVASVTLLYVLLEHYTRIIPSENISPAARAVVKRFYTKYIGTEVVVEGVTSESKDDLTAGYVWSDKLRKVPVQVGKVDSDEELNKLTEYVLHGFRTAYDDNTKTKKYDLNDLLENGDFKGLTDLLKSWITSGGDKKKKALRWIQFNAQYLEEYRLNDYVAVILNYYNKDKPKELSVDDLDVFLNEKDYNSLITTIRKLFRSDKLAIVNWMKAHKKELLKDRNDRNVATILEILEDYEY